MLPPFCQLIEPQKWVLEKMHCGNNHIRIKNQGTGEYLYAAADDLASDRLRRRVFTWTNTSVTPLSHFVYWDKTADWEIELEERGFLLKNIRHSEYLYAAPDDLSFDADHRSVFTWKNYNDLGYEGHWRFNKDVESNFLFSLQFLITSNNILSVIFLILSSIQFNRK
jgi:hypothetical protein